MLDEREKPPPAEGGLSEVSSAGCFDTSGIKLPRPNTQIKFQEPAEAEFDGEIAIILAASGWRATGLLLALAATNAEAGDFLSAERNRRRARELFIESNDAFHCFKEARAAEADWIRAEALS